MLVVIISILILLSYVILPLLGLHFSPWQNLCVICICAICWVAFTQRPPKSKKQTKSFLHIVNAGVFSSILIVIFTLILHSSKIVIEEVTVATATIVWVSTVLFITRIERSGIILRRLTRVVIIGGLLVAVFYEGGWVGFLDRLDDFGAAVIGSSERISNMKLSMPMKAVFVFIQAFVVLRYYGKMWQHDYYRKIGKALKLEADALNRAVIVGAFGLSAWLSVIFMGLDALSVSVFSGLLALGVSVALKDLLTNFVSGILLLWDKTLKVGDVISLDGVKYGWVDGISLRYMVIRDRNEVRSLVPHQVLTNSTIENWSRGDSDVRLKLDVSVGYDSPIDKVRDIMLAICMEHRRVVDNPPPNPLIIAMEDSGIRLQLRFRIRDPEKGIRNVMSEIYERLLDRFKAQGIEIPYPQHEVRMRSPERLDEDYETVESKIITKHSASRMNYNET